MTDYFTEGAQRQVNLLAIYAAAARTNYANRLFHGYLPSHSAELGFDRTLQVGRVACSRHIDHESWHFIRLSPDKAAERGQAPRFTARDTVAVMTDYGKDPQVIPYLLYADAGAAMDWLIAAFGFTERVRDHQDDGTMRHGELLLDHGGVIMLGSAGVDFRGPATLGEVTQLQCITITDLAAHRERAQAAGAHVSEIAIRANRAHHYTVDDPEGHRWYFSEPLLASSACGESSCWDGVRAAPSALTPRSGYGQRLACQAPGRRAAARRGADLGPQAGRRAAARHGPAD